MSADDNTYDYYQAIEQARIFTIVIATISTLFPLSVVIILIQKYNTIVRGKSFVHYVLCIAIADTMTALFLAFGYPAGTVVCKMQGFGLLLFSRFSWFYTDVLVIQLFNVVVFKQYFLNIKYMHCIVWSLNLLLQILPFTTGTTYGRPDDDGTPFVACALRGGKSNYDSYFWLILTDSSEIVLSFCLIIVLSVVIVYYCLRTSTSDTYVFPIIRDSWSLVIMYPAAMLVAWIPSEIYAAYALYFLSKGNTLPANNNVVFTYLVAISALYGPLLSIIFYTKTLEARRAWLYNLRYVVHLVMKKNEDDYIEEDDGIRCSSIISIDDRMMSDIRQTSNNRDKSVPDNYVLNPIKREVPNRISIYDVSNAEIL